MTLRLLIDGIVRQTTVLLAELSTASGLRAPLSHVADQVFYELAREIEAHGVRRQVVADMFGLALRSYQKKMSRLAESASAPDRTLWEAVLSFIEDNEPTREEVLARFHKDGERAVAAVLTDLVRSGLCFVTGSGDAAVYGVTREDMRTAIERRADLDALANVLWLKVFHNEVAARDEMQGLLPGDASLVDAAIDELVASGRLAPADGQPDAFSASNVVLPLGLGHGFEAAALDHFRAACVTIALKIRRAHADESGRDDVGGSTFTFTVDDAHPFAGRVRGLLREKRAELQALWDEVAAHNDAVPPGVGATRVTFYLGQSARELEGERSRRDANPRRGTRVGRARPGRLRPQQSGRQRH